MMQKKLSASNPGNRLLEVILLSDSISRLGCSIISEYVGNPTLMLIFERYLKYVSLICSILMESWTCNQMRGNAGSHDLKLGTETLKALRCLTASGSPPPAWFRRTLALPLSMCISAPQSDSHAYSILGFLLLCEISMHPPKMSCTR